MNGALGRCHPEPTADVVIAQQALERCPRTGEWWQDAWNAARALRGVIDHGAVPDFVVEVVEEWGGDMVVETFLDIWDRVKVPLNVNPVDAAFTQAKNRNGWSADIGPGWRCGRIHDNAQMLATAIGVLNSVLDGPAFLSCRSAGEHLDISYRSAAWLLRRLVGQGVLCVTTPSTRTHAARYLYVGRDARQSCTEITEDHRDHRQQ